MGIGNVLRHDDVQQSKIWITVREHFGPLLAAVEAELAEADPKL